MGRRVMAVLLLLAVCVGVPMQVRAEGAWQDGSVVHVRTEERVVALTFDDGPHPRYTPRLLEVLARHDVKATFFMVGINVERYPSAAHAVADAGHEIGNHTMHHARLSGRDEEAIRDEVEACERLILDTTKVKPVLFRAPEGARGKTIYTVLDSMGYRQILWNLDTLDWQGRSSAAITAAVTKGIRGGDIILCHDYVSGELKSDEALERLIPALKARGYRFVTVSELLACGEVITPHF